LTEKPYPQRTRLLKLLAAAQSVDSAAISAQALQQGVAGIAIGKRLDAAREAAIASALENAH
jgi:tRNA nucleotidyltransferase (CCA-adding enzyme)